MKTNLAESIRDTPAGKEADRILRACVHCGFCTATCPTSQLLGDDPSAWRDYDASELVKADPFPGPILIDQGMADKFLAEQLHPDVFEAACKAAKQSLQMRRHPV